MAGEVVQETTATVTATAAVAAAGPPPPPPSSGDSGGGGGNGSSSSGGGSPCFDISEFLGTPGRKDGSGGGGGGGDEVFSGLNLSPYMPPIPTIACCKSESMDPHLHDADFSALLLYRHQNHHRSADSTASCGGGGGIGSQASGGGHGGGGAGGFDDVDAAFGLFGSLDPSSVNHSLVSSPFPPSGEALRSCSSSSFPMFGQHGSFLAGDHCCGVVAMDDPSSLMPDVGGAAGSGNAANGCFAAAGGGGGDQWGVACGGDGPHHHHLHHHHHHQSTTSSTTPPPPPLQQHSTSLQCDSCQILRCIIHSNGVQDTKLEIHGCDNISYHAVLHTRFCIDDGFPTALEQQMVEFPVGNAEYVRQFLLQYSLLRRKEGFVLRHDSLSAGVEQGSGFSFVPERGYNVSSAFLSKQIGADFPSNGAYSKSGQTKAHTTGSTDGNDQGEPSAAPAKPPKSNAAAQRERTGKLKMSDLAQHFHLPINAAAKELGICPTVLKKICRRNGMRRWPHRKIKSIERIIATLEQTIAEGAGQGDEGIRMEIAMLRNERAQLCAGLLGQN